MTFTLPRIVLAHWHVRVSSGFPRRACSMTPEYPLRFGRKGERVWVKYCVACMKAARVGPPGK